MVKVLKNNLRALQWVQTEPRRGQKEVLGNSRVQTTLFLPILQTLMVRYYVVVVVVNVLKENSLDLKLGHPIGH